MLPEKLKEVLTHEGVVTVVTQGENGPHASNTWNSYIQITEDENILYPAGGMKETEANINKNNNVIVTLGSREVEGFYSKGTGFSIKGTAEFIESGAEFDLIKEKFPWARATVKITVESVKQTL